MCRLDFFVALNRPWQLIKTFASEIDTAYGTWWIDMSHLARVFSCNFAFTFGSHY